MFKRFISVICLLIMVLTSVFLGKGVTDISVSSSTVQTPQNTIILDAGHGGLTNTIN